jgi:type I restriction enzyme S subunit
MTHFTNNLPRGWVSTPMSDIAYVNPRWIEDEPTDSELVSFVPMAAVEAGSGRLDPTTSRTWMEVKKGYTRFQDGDVLFAKITPCMENGKVALAAGLLGGRGAGSTEFHVLRLIDGVEPRFILYFLLQESLRREARTRMKGAAGQLRVPPEFLEELTLPLPPSQEQRRIVAEIDKQLTRLEAGVVALRRVRANLKRYRAAVLKAAVEGRLVPTEAELARCEGLTYEPAGELLKRILAERRARWEAEQIAKMHASGKEPRDDKWKAKYQEPKDADADRLPGLPEGWKWVTIPQLGELNRGKSKHRPRDDVRLFGGPYPFIQTGDVKHSGGYIRNHSQTYNATGLAQSRLWPAGTLCITIAANIAESGILTYAACFPDSVVGFLMEGHRRTVRFVQFFLETAKAQLSRFAPATAQKNINLEALYGLALPLPPLSEQHRIVVEVERRFSVIDELETQLDANLKRAERLRQAILKRAFEGKFVPQDPNDEPASVLLERIRAQRVSSEGHGGLTRSKNAVTTVRKPTGGSTRNR